jgi:hypothetical protein
MSRTYEICCDACKMTRLIGQGQSAEMLSIYWNERHVTELNAFLRQHIGHPLRVLDTELVPKGYRRINGEDPDLAGSSR